MSVGVMPPGWYPDPGRAHQLRYFDGNAWTDHVSNDGEVSQAPLGPVPPGLLAWAPPRVMAASAITPQHLVDVPRVKMWVLALLSAFVFWIRTSNLTIVIPFGVLFAIWCWRATSEALASHERAGSPAVTEIKVARWLAVGLAILSLAQVALWTR